MPVTDSNTPGAPAKNGRSNLMMRVLAALVLVPLAIAAAYIGGNLWLVLVTVTAIGLFAEWLVMTGGAKPVPLGAGILTLVIIAVALALGHLGAALIGGVGGLLAVAGRPAFGGGYRSPGGPRPAGAHHETPGASGSPACGASW